jgi:hypothetical protein
VGHNIKVPAQHFPLNYPLYTHIQLLSLSSPYHTWLGLLPAIIANRETSPQGSYACAKSVSCALMGKGRQLKTTFQYVSMPSNAPSLRSECFIVLFRSLGTQPLLLCHSQLCSTSMSKLCLKQYCDSQHIICDVPLIPQINCHASASTHAKYDVLDMSHEMPYGLMVMQKWH